MERLKFLVRVPRGVALAHGKGSFGEVVYEPTDEWLAQLSSDERTQFDALCGQLREADRHASGSRGEPERRLYARGGWIVPELDAPLDADTVLAALRRALVAEAQALAERDAQRAVEAEAERVREIERAAEREALIARILASPYEAFFDEDGDKITRAGNSGGMGAFFEYSNSSVDCADDPRVSAHVGPFLARASQRKVEIEAAKVAKQAADQAAAESADHECRLWAAEHTIEGHPEITRAARENRNVRKAVLACIIESVGKALGSLSGPATAFGREVWVADDFYDDEPRTDVPSPAAYALFDGLTQALPKITQAALLPQAQVGVGPIARIDVASKGTCYRTGCIVSVTHPWFESDKTIEQEHTYQWAVLCEPYETDDADAD